MKRRFSILPFLALAPVAHAAVVTITATSEVMHTGQADVPPLTFRATLGGSYIACTTSPTLSTTATTSSAAGNYAITAGGSPVCGSGNTYTFVAGNMVVLPALDVPVFGVPNQARSGAILTLNTTKPTGFMPTVQTWASTAGCTITSDGTGDNSACIQSILAYNRSTGTDYSDGASSSSMTVGHRGIYFPAGTYAVCATALAELGNALTIRGAGPGQTTIKLTPGCSTYASSNTPVFHNDSVGGNSSFRNFLADFTLEVAPGNPHALGIVFSGNNVSGMENVRLVCDDGQCPVGLSLDLVTGAGISGDTGPLLIKNVEVINFQKCFDLGDAGQFGVTAENITGMGCNDSGYTAIDQHAWVRHPLFSLAGSAPGVNLGANNAVVVGGNFIAGSGGASTYGLYSHDGGTILAQDTLFTGFGTSLNDNGTTFTATTITEHYSQTAATLFSSGTTPGMLHLPVLETPVASDPATSSWVAFGADMSTWNATVNGGQSTFYVPFGNYTTGAGTTGSTVINTVNVPCTANHIFGNDITPGISGYGGKTQIAWVINSTCAGGTPPLILEHIGMYNTVSVAGNRDVVVRHGIPITYTNSSAGCRATYWDDVQPLQGNPVTFYACQKFYGRQVDMEQLQYAGGPPIAHLVFDGTGGGVAPIGWILGLKTEQPGDPSTNVGEVLTVKNSARVEDYGGFLFPVNDPGAGSAAIGIYNADFSGTFFQYVGATSAYWRNRVRAQSGSTTLTYGPATSAAPWNQGLYYDLLTPAAVGTRLINLKSNVKAN